MDPPPSPPLAMGSRPPATAAADPPEDPPGVRSGFHGLPVIPWSLVAVQLIPPNSEAVVWPARTAPAARSLVTWVESYSATRSLNTSEASVEGHPSTVSSSFTPMGTPPKGRETSADAAAARAASMSRWLKALSPDSSIAANDASRASVGLMAPARNASTSEQASPNHGSTVTSPDATGKPERGGSENNGVRRSAMRRRPVDDGPSVGP